MFLWRTTFHLFFLAVFVFLYYFFPAWPGKDLLLLPLCFFLAALAHVVAIEVKRVCAFYWRIKTALKRVYSQPLKVRAVDPADYGLDTDLNALKYTRELETLGLRHLEDFRFDMGTPGTTVHRIFVLPSERIYVFLNLLLVAGSFQRFPAHASFLIRTQLAEGRIITINEGGGYRPSLVPKVFSRRFPDIHDPATLVAKHKRFVAEICAGGHTLAPLADLPELLERMQQEHEEMGPLMKRKGYHSWAAALRQSFELVRKEYLEPNPRGPAATDGR